MEGEDCQQNEHSGILEMATGREMSPERVVTGVCTKDGLEP